MSTRVDQKLVKPWLLLALLVATPVCSQVVASFDPLSGQFQLTDSGQVRLRAQVSMLVHGRQLPPDSLAGTLQFTQEQNTGPTGALEFRCRWSVPGLPEATVVLTGEARGLDAFPCTPHAHDATAIRVASGFSHSRLNTGLYARREDWALDFPSADSTDLKHVSREGERDELQVHARGNPLVLVYKPDYFRLHLGRRYFRPGEYDLWAEPVSGWISWKAYGARVTQYDVRHAADWCARKLRSYGLETIILDDGWFVGSTGSALYHIPENVDWTRGNSCFPDGMRALAEYIHARGFKAGIWLSPFGISNTRVMIQHPEWWVRQYPGGPWATSESGWHGPYFADGSVDSALVGWILRGLLAMRDAGYDFFKIDGQKHVAHEAYASASAYFAAKGFTWQQAYRHAWRTIGDSLSGRFLLSCWSRIPENIGNPHAIRIGGDKDAGWDRGPLPAAYDLARYLLEHNICWIDDPDHLVLSRSDLPTARSWATLVGITGTLLTFSDRPEDMSDDKVELLRRILPPLRTRPLELFEFGRPPTLWVLEVDRPFDHWLVVANTTFAGPGRSHIDFAELGLDPRAAYVVYDFWRGRFLGSFVGGFDCVPPGAHDVSVYGIRKVRPYPWIASVSRHLSQGGVSLRSVHWDSASLKLSGTSRLVGGDPYRLTLYVPPGYRFERATTSTGVFAVRPLANRGLELAITVPQDLDLRWSVQFRRTSTGLNTPPAEPERSALVPSVRAYPNPVQIPPHRACSAPARIRYRVPEAERVTLRIFNVLGQRVRTLIARRQGPGEYEIPWDGRDDRGQPVGSGLYFCSLQVGRSLRTAAELVVVH